MDAANAHKDLAELWFEKLLGRAPVLFERAGLPSDEAALVAWITDLPEYRNRFSLCHGAGVIWGTSFGAGRAHKRLE